MQKLTRKEQIERTATALFKSKGFAATSMRDLATALGIEAASIYSHIKSKEEILQRVCFRMADEFFEAIDVAEDKRKTASNRLRAAVAAHVQVLTNNTEASAVFLHEWRHLSEPLHGEFLALRDKYEARFRGIIRSGIQNGEFSVPDEKFAALTVLSALNWIHTWYKPEGKMTPLEIANSLSEMLLNGLTSK
ncbi:TetR family transcriptional regulator [Pontibacter ummariensis]|uniref:Transcriptional regulator, TetR family n=1 Tax=Pontibacter ummariensis TaxID=1610492 RepID=A0A239EZ12_9BACT|nr:TetR/AcrR family transcriptional regulator [Pontibacter ummariensis]PRY12709.1 TetR family transcriptional regulator [Pontibacter ummariensis]SNS49074.1 transcriptional regulator, TetR family [Pontibacter ummariensis]